MEKKELLWINLLKAICIICVFYVHCQTYYGFGIKGVSTYIHPIYVNSFFFASGYLLFRKQLSLPIVHLRFSEYFMGGGRRLFWNITYRLIIPTILFSIIEFIPSYVIRGKEFGVGEFVYKTIGGCTYWFTAALAVAELLILLLLFTRIKNIWFYFVTTCFVFVIGSYLCKENIEIISQYPSCPWQYKEGLLATVFLVSGGVYWMHENLVCKVINKYVAILIAAIYFVLETICPEKFRVLVSMQDVNLLGVLISVVATLALIEFCKIFKSSNVLNYIGRNTISFYFMSGALPIVWSMLVNKFMPEPTMIGLIMVFVGSFSISFLATYLMNKYTPWMFDIRRLMQNENGK